MSDLAIGAIGLGVLFILIFLKFPLGWSMAVVGVGGVAYFTGWRAGLSMLETVPFSTIANYTIACLPLYVMMGAICNHGGISEDLFYSMNKLLGGRAGGLAIATIGACACFAAVSASLIATVATMGRVALPEMRKYKYDDALATGCIACGGTMGILIPPSGMMIIYGIMVEVSIGKLFMAGIIPGILQALFYVFVIFILCKINPNLGPAGPKTTWMEKLRSLRSLWSVILLFGLIMGGIYFGIFSPTEAAGIGAVGGVLIAIVKKRFSWGALVASLIESGSVAAMVLVVMVGANLLVSFLAMSQLPAQVASIVSGWDVNKYIIMGGIFLIYIFLGVILDDMSMVLLSVPVFAPIVMALDLDLIWFGIIVVRAVEIAAITPPIAITVFVMKDIAKDVPMSTIFRGVIPFFISDLFHVALLIAFPQISLFLPGLMRKIV